MKKLFAILLALSGAVQAATLVPVSLLNPVGSTTGQVITSSGPTTTPAFANLPVSPLAQIGANRVLANATSATATPVGLAVPSCSASNTALQWTSNTGFTCTSGYALTGSPLSQFAATTSAQLAGVLSDETGTGSAVFGTAPSISGATITGSSYAGSVAATTVTASSLITPSQTVGIAATNTNNSAQAGSVGEWTASGPSTATGLVNGTNTNIITVTLQPGDWRVQGTIQYTAAGTTVVNNLLTAISTTSATLGALGTFGQLGTQATGSVTTTSTPVVRLLLASPTIVYLIGVAGFSTSTLTASGYLNYWRAR